MTDRGVDHFRAPALGEREAAGRAVDPRAAALHHELADRYAAVADAMAALDRATMRRIQATPGCRLGEARPATVKPTGATQPVVKAACG